MDSYVGEIRLIANNFAPQGWKFCQGQLLAIAEYDTLFSLLGTTYGGDGQTTFALPDLRGRLPLGQGQGPGLTNREFGEEFGFESVTLLTTQLPAHNHIMQASTVNGRVATPADQVFGVSPGDNVYSPMPGSGALPKQLKANSVSGVGGSQPHNNIMPTMALNYIISLYGTYPSRN